MSQPPGTVGLFLAGSRGNRYQDLLARDAEESAGRHGLGLEVYYRRRRPGAPSEVATLQVSPLLLTSEPA